MIAWETAPWYRSGDMSRRAEDHLRKFEGRVFVVLVFAIAYISSRFID